MNLNKAGMKLLFEKNCAGKHKTIEELFECEGCSWLFDPKYQKEEEGEK